MRGILIAALEKLVGSEMRTPLEVRGATMLAQLYSQKGNSDKSIALIRKLRSEAKLVDNIVELNATTVEQGDALFKQAKYGDALECYRAAFSREQIIQMQRDRIAMQRRINANLASARSDPTQFSEPAAKNKSAQRRHGARAKSAGGV